MPNKITPMIRCTDNGAKIAEYYTNIFPDAKITKTNSIVTTFEIFGQSLATINGGPHPEGTPNPSISFSLWVRDKGLTKTIRDKLSDGGNVMMEYSSYPRSEAYGWCNDKYGVSRQVMYDNCEEHTTHTLIPSLMFVWSNAGRCDEAMKFYTSIFPASELKESNIYRYGPNEQDIEGRVNHAEFRLVNQLFIAMESWLDHKFNFNDGISLSIACKDQEEIDYYWDKLTADGGSEVQCGRCKDKYGVSRQVSPAMAQELFFDNPDKEAANYAMQAMMKMKKIVLADLNMK